MIRTRRSRSRSTASRFLVTALLLFPAATAFAAPEPDRDALIELALLDDARDRARLESQIAEHDAALIEANAELGDARAALTAAIDAAAPTEVIEAREGDVEAAELRIGTLEMRIGAANDELIGFDGEVSAVEAAVAGLTDEQVVALNRATNDTRHNGRVIDLDADDLEEIAARELNARQIQSFTKAIEEQGKFEDHAARATDKFEAKGNERHLEQADRFTAKGQTKYDRFMAKVDRQGDPAGDALAESAREAGQARAELRDAAADARAASRDAAHEARSAAHEARDARREARDAAKQASRDARQAAKDARKN